MKKIEPPILPKGFKCIGKRIGIRKKTGEDLTVIASEIPCSAAAMFTKHSYPGACVLVGKKNVQDGSLQAIIAVSGIANVATGKQGYNNAETMCKAVAEKLSVSNRSVLPSATGIIGHQLPINKIIEGLKTINNEFVTDPIMAAKGIMTTDSYPKVYSIQLNDITLTGIAKGAGMIEPNMATMLVYLMCDAEVNKDILRKYLIKNVNKTFNMLSIDTDTSTSDTVAILANGMSGAIAESDLDKMLYHVCYELMMMLARDGEGATKFCIAKVKGANNDDQARKISKLLINSPLIKTMVYGCDPNIGRIVMAIGKICDDSLCIDDLNILLNDHLVMKNGLLCDFDEDKMRRELSLETITFEAHVGKGSGSAEAYGCDLTEGYVEENAAYYST